MIHLSNLSRLSSTDPQGPVVFIASPAYAGMTPQFIKSLLESTEALCQSGFRVQHSFSIGQSLKANAKEGLFGEFLASGADYLALIDPDVGWDRALLLELIAFGMSPIAVPLPGALPQENVLRLGEKKWSQVPIGDEVHHYFWDDEGLVPSDFVFLHRSSAEKIAETAPPIRVGDTKTFAVFHPFEDYDEDHAFFARYRKLGGPVWASATARTSRSKTVTLTGSLASFVPEGP